MSYVDFRCPECGSALEVPRRSIGTKIKCPDCGERVQVRRRTSVPLILGIIGAAGLAVAGLCISLVKGAHDWSALHPAPVVWVDPSIHNVRFGPWRKFYGTNGLGQPVVCLTADVEAVGTKVTDYDFQVENYDKSGRKQVGPSMLLMPDLKPGEKGQAQITIDDDTARVKILPRQ
ncbi:MAG TPA: hypothetical protein VFA18_25585 [Gemmataceae bacterium]|nr:hypothetical protein [Gemmataceae bacterium]